MTENEADYSIASCGRSCSGLFRQLCEYPRAPEIGRELSHDFVKEQSKRFDLWAENIAALQDDQLPSSLGYRIRDDGSARRTVKSALMYLEESLKTG